MRAIHVKTHLETTLFAVEVEALLAIIALAASGDTRDGNPIPHLKILHPFPDLIDDADWLVTKDEPLFYRQQTTEHM
jgi:hypothetical protein